MAQRFGRNQRRRAREALQAAQQLAETRLEAACDQASRAEAMRQEVHALEDVLDEAREMLGASLALPPEHAGSFYRMLAAASARVVSARI